MNSQHEYKSFQQHTEMINGQARTQEKEVIIKNGIGKKTVRYLDPKGKILVEKTLPLNVGERDKILGKNFVPGLFKSCIGDCMKKMEGRPAPIAGGRRGHGAIFLYKHKSRRVGSTAAKGRRSRRKNY